MPMPTKRIKTGAAKANRIVKLPLESRAHRRDASRSRIRRCEEEKKRSMVGISQRLDCPIADGVWSGSYCQQLLQEARIGWRQFEVGANETRLLPYNSLNGPIPICWNFHHICVQRKLSPPRQPDS